MKNFYPEKIRVGKNYQVVVPEMVPTGLPDNYPDKALVSRAEIPGIASISPFSFLQLVWSPAKWIPESKLEEYITLAKESYSYNAEQALGMLFWHKHDLEKAVIDLANFTPYPDEWSKEEKALFAQAFQFHGKCFHRIRQMVSSAATSITNFH
jgi:REST corepressor 1